MKFAYDDNPEAVVALIQHGATVNKAAADGRTALSEAVAQGSDLVVQVLLKAGADPAVRIKGLILMDVAKNKKASFQEVSNQMMISRYDRILEMLAHASRAS
jgi:ankyrin repeat protein